MRQRGQCPSLQYDEDNMTREGYTSNLESMKKRVRQGFLEEVTSSLSNKGFTYVFSRRIFLTLRGKLRYPLLRGRENVAISWYTSCHWIFWFSFSQWPGCIILWLSLVKVLYLPYTVLHSQVKEFNFLNYLDVMYHNWYLEYGCSITHC